MTGRVAVAGGLITERYGFNRGMDMGGRTSVRGAFDVLQIGAGRVLLRGFPVYRRVSPTRRNRPPVKPTEGTDDR
ncbi:hypothetical protein Q0Z83_003070 [Actinoplanes sichuanensis]|nr:hypothetical protein Q0Z83_003070 [Actinoplanes sichuanensis]